MSDSTESSAYFNRIISLVVDVGTETLRDTFYSKVPKKDVSVIFGTTPVKAEFTKLKGKKALTNVQYRKVTAASPDPETYDISLLTTLLTNQKICGIPPPAKGWTVTPLDPADLSLGADLLRLSELRNEIIGHCNKAQLEVAEIKKLWSNVETILVRIAKYVSPAEETKITQMVRSTETKVLEPLYDRGVLVLVEHKYQTKLTEVQNSQENLSLEGDTTQKRQSSESAGGSEEKTFIMPKDDNFYRRLLHRSHQRFLLDLDPVSILDLFVEEEYLTYTQVRDIQEQRFTSDKIREILKAVGKRGARGYKKFRSLLVKSDHEHLAEYLDEQEAALEKETEIADKEKPVTHVQNVQTDDTFYRRVLHRSHQMIFENLDPVLILDLFEEEGYLTQTHVRDIQEQRLTSDKIREILKAVSQRGASGYKKFRSLLIKSDQEHLAEYLDEQEAALEKEIEMAEKEKHVTHVQNVQTGGSWESSIEESDWKMAETLLDQEVLPDKQQLRLVCKTLGRKSDLVLKICTKICDNISGSIEGKVKVFPAVKPGEETDIIFVVTGKSNIHELVCNYNVKYHRGSAETKAVMTKRKQLPKPRQLNKIERMEVKKCINALELEFFTKHKNLSVVESSPYRSKGYRGDNHELIEEICIVLGVTVKGYIPIGEDKLPPEIGKFGTDIREITVHKCKDGSPSSYHKSIKMNCVISREPQNRHERVSDLGRGTVGVFMSETCNRNVREECLGSTCAHVLLVPNEMKKIQKDKRMWRENENKPDIICNQPDFKSISSKCGKVKYALFTEDVDVVLFSPDETRLPTNGFFPGNCLSNAKQELSFSDGKFIDPDEDEIYETPVLKMPGGGIADKITCGEIVTSDAIIRDTSEDYLYILRNQIQILSDEEYFSKSGDSGSCVFTKDEQNCLHAVGMIVADNSEEDGEDSRISYATPITQIIEAFRLQQIELSLTTFSGDGRQEDQQITTDMKSGTLVDNNSNRANSFEKESVDKGASGEGLTKG